MSKMVTVVDGDAYENSLSLATAAQQMFSDVVSKNPNISDNSKISGGLTKLVQDITNKADGNTVMMDVHVGTHPTLIMTYKIQTAAEPAVPEFPLPALLSVISIAGVVVATRFKSHLKF